MRMNKLREICRGIAKDFGAIFLLMLGILVFVFGCMLLTELANYVFWGCVGPNCF